MTLCNNEEIQKRMESINQQIEHLNEVPPDIMEELKTLQKKQEESQLATTVWHM